MVKGLVAFEFDWSSEEKNFKVLSNIINRALFFIFFYNS